MAMKVGRDAKVVIGGVEVEEVTGISFNPANNSDIEVKTLKSSYTKIIGNTLPSAGGTINMIQDLDDPGQRIMREAAQAPSASWALISGTQIYHGTDLFEADLATDADAGCNFSNYNTDSSDSDNPITATVNFKFSGAIKLTEA